MRYEISSSDIQLFRENGTIEYEELISTEEAELACSIIQERCTDFCEGRDLFRKDAHFKKLISKKTILSIALGLSRQKALIYGSDQVILPTHDTYMPFYQTVKLRKIASIQGAAIGLLLCLKTGNGSFIAPFEEIELASLFEEEKEGAYLLISYAKTGVRYIYNEQDPCTHYLKKEGYAFNDLLKNDTHPVMARST